MGAVGTPSINIVFKGLGASAVQRGSKGVAILLIKDDTNKTFTFATYRSIADLTTTEEAKYSATNLQYIKDALEGTPLKLIVARRDIAGSLSDLLTAVRGTAPRNCWLGIAEGLTADHDALVTWVKAENANNKKRYKALVYNATTPDHMHVVNFANTKVTFADVRGQQTGEKAISYLLGYLAGLPFTMSAIAKVLGKFTTVEEPADLAAAVNLGKFMLYSEDGQVKVIRAVNSLVTTGQDVTDDMKFILIVESMDLIFVDIYDTWNSSYKGRYKNSMDNQLLLIGAIKAYFDGLENDSILDPNFENTAYIDIEAQRLLNIPKYGEEEVNSWDDKKVMQMTFGTQVVFAGDIKILNAMEDFTFKIYM